MPSERLYPCLCQVSETRVGVTNWKWLLEVTVYFDDPLHRSGSLGFSVERTASPIRIWRGKPSLFWKAAAKSVNFLRSWRW